MVDRRALRSSGVRELSQQVGVSMALPANGGRPRPEAGMKRPWRQTFGAVGRRQFLRLYPAATDLGRRDSVETAWCWRAARSWDTRRPNQPTDRFQAVREQANDKANSRICYERYASCRRSIWAAMSVNDRLRARPCRLAALARRLEPQNETRQPMRNDQAAAKDGEHDATNRRIERSAGNKPCSIRRSLHFGRADGRGDSPSRSATCAGIA